MPTSPCLRYQPSQLCLSSNTSAPSWEAPPPHHTTNYTSHHALLSHHISDRVSSPLTSVPSPLRVCGQHRLMHVALFRRGSWAREHYRCHSGRQQKPREQRGRRRGMSPAPSPFVSISLKC
ncbi:uncharacterized [Tachysurus ichikawai]